MNWSEIQDFENLSFQNLCFGVVCDELEGKVNQNSSGELRGEVRKILSLIGHLSVSEISRNERLVHTVAQCELAIAEYFSMPESRRGKNIPSFHDLIIECLTVGEINSNPELQDYILNSSPQPKIGVH